MNVLIISRRSRLYSTRRLREECEALGHVPLVADPLKCVLCTEDGKASLLYRGRPHPAVDVVIPRVGTVGVSYILGVVRHLELMGVPCLNAAQAIARSKNKLACLQELVRRGIRMPDTVISRYPRNLRKLTKIVGGTPLVMKLLHGTHGTGIIYSESLQSVESVLETIWSLGEDILLQQFVAESKGRDLRVLVIGGRVAAAMRRVGRAGEFRSNLHRGGVGEAVGDLSPECAEAAVAAAEAVGLQLAGVDILESDRGPLVIEVNSSPGFQGLEESTRLNVARMIVDRAIELAGGERPASRTG